MALDKTIVLERLPGRKKAKDRITVLPCSNADGIEKIELMIIGKALIPRVFKNKSGQELGLDYHANKKAWMTATLFFEWLARFHTYISKTPGRQALLLLDNCSAHGSQQSMPDMDNVRVVFLPPNTTSKVQPMDAGIIACMKVRYTRLQMERALDLVDENVKNIYKVDVLSAMRWTKVWEEIPSDTIFNCWKHTGLFLNGADSAEGCCRVAAEDFISQEEVHLRRQVEKLVPARCRISINELCSPIDEDDCIQVIGDEELVSNILENEIGECSEEEIVMDEDQDVYLPPAEEQLRALAMVKRIAESTDEDIVEFVHCLRRMQKAIRMARSREARQTTIDSFFRK